MSLKNRQPFGQITKREAERTERLAPGRAKLVVNALRSMMTL